MHKRADGTPGVAGWEAVESPRRVASASRPLAAVHDEHAQRAFAEAYAQCYAPVWRCLRALGVPVDQLDDAAQDVFLVVHRKLPHFDHATSVRSWILGIARNVALKVHDRRRRPGPRLVLVQPEPSAPEELLARREAAVVVERFLDTLQPEQRAVFVLAQLEGLSVPEIADVLGIKLNTAYSRLRLARRCFDRVVARHAAMQDRRIR